MDRRSIIRTGISSAIIGLGATKGVSATRGEKEPDEVRELHQDDWFSIPKAKFNRDATLQKTIARSPALSAITSRENVFVFVNEGFVENNILNDNSGEDRKSLTHRAVEQTEEQKGNERTNGQLQSTPINPTDHDIDDGIDGDPISIHLGYAEDESISTCDVGLTDTDGFWGDEAAEARHSHDEIHCEADMGPVTVTSNYASAWIGRKIITAGYNSKQVTISTDIIHNGYIWAAFKAKSYCELKFGLVKEDGLITVDETIVVKETVAPTVNEYTYINGESSEALYTELEPNTNYYVYVYLKAGGTGDPAGGHRAQIGDNLYNSPDTYVEVEGFDLIF